MAHDVCMVFCSSDCLDLNNIRSALKKDGLTVENNSDELRCFRDDSPKFTIRFNQEVQTQARALGEEYPNYRSRLKNCNASFEILFDDLSEVLNEVNTLIDIQITLQDKTDGIIFTSWNGIIEI